jgi:hypothetical protein
VRAFRRDKKLRLTFLALMPVLFLASSAVFLTSPSKPGIDVQLTPGSTTVQRGRPAVYTVMLTSIDGFAGAVDLSADQLPKNTTAVFTPARVTLTASGATSTATSTLTVTTTASTPLGAGAFTVTAARGKTHGSATGGLTVSAASDGSLAMTSTPATVSMTPGATAVYTIALTRTGITGPVAFTVAAGLPSGATARFSPASTTGNTSTLQVTTTGHTDEDGYSLRLQAEGVDASGATRTATSDVRLVLTQSHRRFTISGDAAGSLSPGATRPIDLTLTNPDDKSMSVTNVTVTIRSVVPLAGRSCAASDYTVSQYGGPYPVVVPGHGSRSLSQLGVRAQQWPKATFVDRPVNQDGCKGARVELDYIGSGQGR